MPKDYIRLATVNQNIFHHHYLKIKLQMDEKEVGIGVVFFIYTEMTENLRMLMWIYIEPMKQLNKSKQPDAMLCI